MDKKPTEATVNVTTEGGLGSVPIRTTRPEEILMHHVSDGDLNELAHSRTSRIENMLWAMVGAAVGAFIPAMEDFYKAFWGAPPQPITFLSLLKIIIFVVPTALAIFAITIIAHKEKSGKQLLDEIRQRPKS